MLLSSRRGFIHFDTFQAVDAWSKRRKIGEKARIFKEKFLGDYDN
jgi:hypothetical protein